MKRKNFYISVDLEGIACVTGAGGQGLTSSSADYAFACRQATAEANAAAKALFDSGAERVIVWDSHGTGYNLDYYALDKRVEIAIGAGSGMRFPLIDESFGGVLFIGYHAYDTPKSVLSHVYSSSTFQHHKINGRFVGEMQIDAAIAGKRNVPVIFAAGDDVCMAQAIESFGDIPTVVTKKALAWHNCVSKHPAAVCDEIYNAVLVAAEKCDGMEAFLIPEPFQLEIRYKRIEYATACALKNPDGSSFDMPDAYTRSGVLECIEKYFNG